MWTSCIFGYKKMEDLIGTSKPTTIPKETRKKALLVGFNYIGTSDELGGCENDLALIKKILSENFGYSNIETVNDGSGIKSANDMLNLFLNFFEGAKSGDKYFLYYSGHGTSVNDRNGDEKDGRDEALYLHKGVFTDDMINHVFGSVPSGVKITFIVDACCSGTIADLKYRLSFGDLESNESKLDIKADIVMISGCEDERTSSESVDKITGKTQGALTSRINEMFSTGNPRSYSWTVFCGFIGSKLKRDGFTQKPQLCASKISLMMEVVDF